MQVVLIEPLIPQNTGSIARTCAATQTPLHLIGKLGFDISEKAVRRAGLDYWPYVEVLHHPSWEDYLTSQKPQRIWLFSKYAHRKYFEVNFESRDALVFGNETNGLGKTFMDNFSKEQILYIPMVCEQVRSLNLSNAVAIALYEAKRQVGWDHA